MAALSLVTACATAESDPIVLGDGPSVGGGTSGSSGSGLGGSEVAGTSGTGGEPATGGAGVDAGGSSGSSGGGASGSSGSGGSMGGSGATAGRGGTSATGGTSGTSGTAGVTAAGPKATIPLPYTDDFEDGDALDWFADAPTPADSSVVGDWSVIDDGGNKVYQEGTAYGDESWTVGGDRYWTDVRIEARVMFVSETAAGDGLIYLGARWAPGDKNYYFAEFRSDGKPKVRRKTNGSSTDVLTFDIDPIVAGMGTWHTLALTLAGADVTLEVNGEVLGTATDDAPLAQGGIALGTRDCVAVFDDVHVTEP